MSPEGFGSLRRIVAVVLLLFFSFLILSKGVVPSFTNTRGDFANYYTAARLLQAGETVEPAYRDFVWFQKQMDRFGIRKQVGGFIPHPPATAMVLLPLAGLEALTAKRVWAGFNLVLVVLCVYLLSRITALDWMLVGIIFLGSGVALINHFLFGQLYLLLLASILLALYLEGRGRLLLAGLCLGIMIPVKYVGGVWVAYYLWKRQTRLVLSSLATALLVLLLAVWLGGWETFETFFSQVLPRHLSGEIQDPFSSRAQSWNTLFRRLFVFEQTLNPHPWFNFPPLYVVCKNAVFWSLAAAAVTVLARLRFGHAGDERLFALGWLPIPVLLLAPVTATYHFLLLTLSVACFVSLLIRRERHLAAFSLIGGFIVLNLPHYLWLEQGVLRGITPLLYSRLLLLFGLACLVVGLFRKHLVLGGLRYRVWAGMLAGWVLLVSGVELVRLQGQPSDAAQWLEITGTPFQEQLGLILASPDVGGASIVFSYCELMRERYSIFAADGSPWATSTGSNLYNPNLSQQGLLLAETIRQGSSEILLSRGRGQELHRVGAGSQPSWSPEGGRFAYLNGGDVYLREVGGDVPRRLTGRGEVVDLDFSPGGEAVVYSFVQADSFGLGLVGLVDGSDRVLLESQQRILSPEWAPDRRHILFAWQTGGNRDLWALRLDSGELFRLTRHPGADDEPVWDSANRRILFTSDRDRGLEFSTLYWIPIPPELQ